MPNSAIIFDLDGTLLDTIGDISASANATLAHFGLPALSLNTYKSYVGNGIRGLAEKILPPSMVSEESIDQFVAFYRGEYEKRWDQTAAPFPGVPEMLDELVKCDVPLAVLSNKRDEFTKKCVEKLLSHWNFAVIRGEMPGVPLKPNPASALAVAKDLGVPAGNCTYVGDSEIDVAVAFRAGMKCVAVAWGFREKSVLEAAGAKVIIHHPRELMTVLG